MIAPQESAKATERFIRQGPLRIWRYRHIAWNEAQDLASGRVLTSWGGRFEAICNEVVEELVEEWCVRRSRSPNGVT